MIMPTFRLVMRSGPSAGKVFPLDKPEIIVGRDLNNDIMINDPEVSRRHARFYFQGNSYVLEDLGSTNGTFINGQRLSGPYALHIGEAITFGERINVVFETEDIPEDSTIVNQPPRPLEPRFQSPAAPPPPVYPTPSPVYAPQPSQRPVQQPIQQLPPMQPMQPMQPLPVQGGFAGQVPYQAAQPKPANRNMRMIIILVVVLLLVVCVCAAVGLYLAPKEFWCMFPVWPAGSCP
jgi:pSer/pThr/pTyr-binding forkhead associated (FHA) protein